MDEIVRVASILVIDDWNLENDITLAGVTTDFPPDANTTTCPGFPCFLANRHSALIASIVSRIYHLLPGF